MNRINAMKQTHDTSVSHTLGSLAETDPAVSDALDNEAHRQCTQIGLIASENFVSRAVREALGHEVSNKSLEGYPGHRFHGGGEHVDVVERLAIERAKKLFGAAYANVQPHSGTQANQAVFFTLLTPGDRVLSLDLAAGGHLSHGAPANVSGQWFEAHHYGVDRDTGLLDYDAIERQAREVRPAVLIAGGSAYPRSINFERMAQIAELADARLVVDMAHIAGLVAAGVHASPLAHADIVTGTTTKTLGGPGGDSSCRARSNSPSGFSPRCSPAFRGASTPTSSPRRRCAWARRFAPSSPTTGAAWSITHERSQGPSPSAGSAWSAAVPTPTWCCSTSRRWGSSGRSGNRARARRDHVNKNPVPFDARSPARWTGLRLGVSAVTTRGFGTAEMKVLGARIADLLRAACDDPAVPVDEGA